jgi:hypothetical protein
MQGMFRRRGWGRLAAANRLLCRGVAKLQQQRESSQCLRGLSSWPSAMWPKVVPSLEVGLGGRSPTHVGESKTEDGQSHADDRGCISRLEVSSVTCRAHDYPPLSRLNMLRVLGFPSLKLLRSSRQACIEFRVLSELTPDEYCMPRDILPRTSPERTQAARALGHLSITGGAYNCQPSSRRWHRSAEILSMDWRWSTVQARFACDWHTTLAGAPITNMAS